IPFNLIIEILSLLPVKSLIRFQSVSKLWFSTIRSKTFVDSFLTRSEARPRLLFTFYHKESRRNFIFSAPEYEYSDDGKYFSSAMARYDMTISDPDYFSITVYNPTTRQLVKLPDYTSNGRYVYACLGYDPVEDQYKVLYIQQEHFVCTLSSFQIQEWRKIENPTGDNYRSVFFERICIDCALYYGTDESRIVRFDVRSEKIEFIKTPEESHISTSYHSAFINYNGKLGGLECCCTTNMIQLWVLEDAEKQEWSSMTYALPNE
ncbi:unnamed protein product, partial [Brassica oleracea]